MSFTPARKRGMIVSGTMHAIILLLIILGLPSLLFDTEIEEPTAITVDILPIAALSNVKPSKQTPVKPKEEEKPKEEPKKEEPKEDPLEELKEEKKKASPVVKTKEEEPPPPEVKEDPDAAKEKEKEKPKDKPKKEEQKEDPLDAILKGVKNTASQEKPSKSSEKKSESSSSSANRSNRFDPNSPEAVTIRDAIQSQIYRCWNVPAGARNAEELIVPLEIDYDAQGNPLKVAISSKAQARYASDPFFKAAADSAVRAVRRCAPLENLPVESFAIWQYVDMNFNPRDMLY